MEEFFGKPEGRPRHRCEDSIRMYLREVGWEHVDWIHLAPGRDQWWVLVNTYMNIWVGGEFLD